MDNHEGETDRSEDEIYQKKGCTSQKSIVSKNIDLAKSGQGVLSTTEDEKLRLDLLTSNDDFKFLDILPLPFNRYEEEMQKINTQLQELFPRSEENRKLTSRLPEAYVRLGSVNKKLNLIKKNQEVKLNN